MFIGYIEFEPNSSSILDIFLIYLPHLVFITQFEIVEQYPSCLDFSYDFKVST